MSIQLYHCIKQVPMIALPYIWDAFLTFLRSHTHFYNHTHFRGPRSRCFLKHNISTLLHAGKLKFATHFVCSQSYALTNYYKEIVFWSWMRPSPRTCIKMCNIGFEKMLISHDRVSQTKSKLVNAQIYF